MKVILLEDDYSLGDNIKEFLEMHHYEVDLYRDGLTFLDRCSFSADIYILDIEVPGANGYEVIEWIKNNCPDTPVIFATAYTDIDSITKSYALGCSDYLKKPYDMFELLLRIQKLLPFSETSMVQISPNHQFDMQNKQFINSQDKDKLSKTQKEILYVLIKFKNKIVTYDMLIEYVWDNSFVKVNTIATHVKEIRRVLPELDIESIRAEGYLLHIK